MLMARFIPANRRPVVIRIMLAVLTIGALLAAYGWWSAHWRPDRAEWPMQGVAIGAANAPVSWPAMAQQGASFAYIDATIGSRWAGPDVLAAVEAARAAGLRVGAVHHFALCSNASEQAAAFVRLIARDADALPPAVMLDIDPACARVPTRALLLSELSTFLNQVETHMGKSAVIAPSSDFEQRYDVRAAINRPLWIRRARSAPAEDSGPWVIWQANDDLRITGATGKVRWLVLNGNGTALGDGTGL
jgi:lysozyme